MLGIIVTVILVGILGSINFYLSKRVYSGISAVFSEMPFGIILSIFIVFAVVMVLGFSSSMLPFPNGIKKFLGTASSYFMGVFAYLLLFVLLSDFVFLILKLFGFAFIKSSIYRVVSLSVVLALTLTTVTYGIINARSIKHISYNIKIEEKDDISDIKLVFISDLHLGAVGSEARLIGIIQEINSLKPDIVCIAGDFFDTDYSSIKNPEKAMETVKQIKSQYGVYACLGNHDAGKTTDKMQNFLKECNIHLLNDEYTVIADRLILIGRLDGTPIGGYGDISRKKLDDFYKIKETNLPVIVLDHNPANIDEYSDNVDLILSGHTHKGQIFPANIVTELMYKVDYGYYREKPDLPQVVVSSGVGTWGMPMRVGSDCEIVSIEFSK